MAVHLFLTVDIVQYHYIRMDLKMLLQYISTLYEFMAQLRKLNAK